MTWFYSADYQNKSYTPKWLGNIATLILFIKYRSFSHISIFSGLFCLFVHLFPAFFSPPMHFRFNFSVFYNFLTVPRGCFTPIIHLPPAPVSLFLLIICALFLFSLSSLLFFLPSLPFLALFLQIFGAANQWLSKRGGGGGKGAECPAETSDRDFCWHIGKKEARKKGERGENWEEKKENCKREGGKGPLVISMKISPSTKTGTS